MASLMIGCGMEPQGSKVSHANAAKGAHEGHDHSPESCGAPLPSPHDHSVHSDSGLGTHRAALCAPGGRTSPCVPAPAGAVEGYASYAPQRTCSASAKPGVTAFKDLILKTFPCTGNFGIVRGCSVGGKSEHKEGRAWDWKVYAHNQGKIADAVINWLLATRNGVPHALARRLGIMYMVWNRRIWSAYRHKEGWRPYSGASPHTDHIHFSFSWAGANKQTSFWKSSCNTSSSCKPACVSSTKIRGKDCGVGDCAAFGARCSNDRLGVRCTSVFCPPLGTKKFCYKGQVGSCKDGKVTFTKCSSTKTCQSDKNPVCVPKHSPIGYLDLANCTEVAGWTQDPDHKTKSIDAHIYFKGGPGAKGAVGISTKAGNSRSDLCKAIGSCKHGFSVMSPHSLHDNKSHPVYAYGIDVDKVKNAGLKGSPKQLKCAARVPKGFVRRHITNMTAFKAWKISDFWDQMPLTENQILALSKSHNLPATPLVVKVSGSTALWLIDTGFRRKVPTNWKTTWRFDAKKFQTWTKTKLMGYPEAPGLHSRLITVRAASGAVYLLDAKLPPKPKPREEPKKEPVGDGGTNPPPPTPDAGAGDSPDNGGTTPNPPTNPTAPADPTDPAAPQDPTDPAQPGDPAAPANPAPPQDPSDNPTKLPTDKDSVTELPKRPGNQKPNPGTQGYQIGDGQPQDAPFGGLALLFLALLAARKRS